MNKEVKKTISFLIILLASFAIVDWVFGKFAYNILIKMPQSSGEIAKMNYQIEYSDYDCYILGSSRAVHHYNPFIIKDSLRFSTYNAGCDGQGISYADGLLNAIIDRHLPKVVILECGQIELANNWLEKMSTLKPYYKEHPKLLTIAMKINGSTEKLKCISSFYRFNSKFFQVLKAYALGSEDNSYGYEPFNSKVIEYLSYNKDTKEIYELGDNAKSVLEDFVKTCKRNNIRLVAFCSPVLYDYSEVSQNLNEVFKELDVPFYDYSNDTTFINHNELFGDFVHLNSEGADIYTKKIIKDLRNQ